MMEIEGIDRMVLYPTRGLFANAIADLDGRISAAISRAYNRWIRDYCDAAPDRFVGVALVGLHDPKLAVEEARHAVEDLHLQGIMVRPNPVHGRNLHDPAYDEFYACVASLGVPLSIHEGCGVWMPQYGVDRFSEHIAWHAMCHPMEQMGAVLSFTLGGVMERHPTLRALADSVGADRLLWASDYPHPDAKFPGSVSAMLDAEGLTDAEKRSILSDNPTALYNLRHTTQEAERALG
jgi:predicted TIM-barrel fold metal-dependent hydrolase